MDELQQAINGTIQTMNVSRYKYRRPWDDTGNARQSGRLRKIVRQNPAICFSYNRNRGLSLF
ncbi:hypothetical protein [Nitrosomonas sp. Nm33]|uniref:hypothetical protein n=1 Tax=Nitrosomonas sp. Nm33 TaxID=133724 RepID=UPI000899D49D|nr:hypothetical protein [Nitrosomonas sp. Nm33]SDY17796.1 hypothetical protein SAMN05421755_101041 [Nitrosomonas sp. Nm33]